MRLHRYFRVDVSAIFLLLSNGLIIYFAIVEEWNIMDVMWIYWAQSLMIGFFNFLHILDLKDFSTEGYDKARILGKMSMKGQMALFFFFHWGLLHIIFLAFLLYIWRVFPSLSPPMLALCIIVFLTTHAAAYWMNRHRDVNRKPNIGDVVFHPYARVLPMWVILAPGIYYAEGSLTTLVLFLALKTVADMIMHVRDPVIARGNTTQNGGII